MVLDVGFNAVPMVFIVADFLAGSAYGQEAAEGFDFRQSISQIAIRLLLGFYVIALQRFTVSARAFSSR